MEKYTFSVVCAHLGCIVTWNNLEKSSDCTCHGSCFSNRGKVINYPAIYSRDSRKPYVFSDFFDELVNSSARTSFSIVTLLFEILLLPIFQIYYTAKLSFIHFRVSRQRCESIILVSLFDYQSFFAALSI
jgi:Rieske [2Fe-2S] domain